MAQREDEPAQELRKRAEEKFRENQGPAQENMSPEDARQLLHELQVHQIELEIQNEELRRSQQINDDLRARYFDLYDLAPVGYLTLSRQGLIVEANLTCANLLGVVKAQLVNHQLSHFIFPEDQDHYYLCRQQLAGPGRTGVCELRMVRADGSLFWAYLQAVSAAGRLTACLCPVGDNGYHQTKTCRDRGAHRQGTMGKNV